MKRILTKQQRYDEHQKAMGRRQAKFWVTPEEAELLREYLKEYRAFEEKRQA